MRNTNEERPFDTNNRAYQRFQNLLTEHLDLSTWTRQDGRPVMATLLDIDSGDAFTVTYLDSTEARETHALLAITSSGELAANHAPHLAMHDASVAATRPVPLHHPNTATLPNDAWLPVPPPIASSAHPALTGAPLAFLVLLDRTHGLLATMGPFPDHATAATWRPTQAATDCDHLVVPLLPASSPGDLP